MEEKRLETIIYNLIIMMADSDEYYLDDEDFIDMICLKTGMDINEYKNIMELN